MVPDYIITLFLFLSRIQLSAHNEKYLRKEGKIVLDPLDLVDLVVEERQKIGVPSENRWSIVSTNKNSYEDIEMNTEQECHDEESLKARKVWSRWSKWGGCSVTCGGGTIARVRICVAGRCAPGEREEQRRPCARAPCKYPQFDATIEDVHEAE